MARLATAALPSSATPFTLPARVAGRIAQVWRAWRNRREFIRLGEMTDAELADVGLRRADLSAVVGLPLGADPTAHLGAVASARLRSVEEGARFIA